MLGVREFCEGDGGSGRVAVGGAGEERWLSSGLRSS